jgi:hypothetical protein
VSLAGYALDRAFLAARRRLLAWSVEEAGADVRPTPERATRTRRRGAGATRRLRV